MITVEGLCKTFKVAKRSAGFKTASICSILEGHRRGIVW